MEQIGPVTYRLVKENGTKIPKVHVNRMRLYHETLKDQLLTKDEKSDDESASGDVFEEWTEVDSSLTTGPADSQSEAEPDDNVLQGRPIRQWKRPAWLDNFVCYRVETQ